MLRDKGRRSQDIQVNGQIDRRVGERERYEARRREQGGIGLREGARMQRMQRMPAGQRQGLGHKLPADYQQGCGQYRKEDEDAAPSGPQ
ncbi:hypothetical protein AWB81_08550 [Caballeronia arationis]|jgi:hypothetical protein|nr:hypothetical protein AWB81_08550 [Caballeronia arationis]